VNKIQVAVPFKLFDSRGCKYDEKKKERKKKKKGTERCFNF
jgi:hypothetical protein